MTDSYKPIGDGPTSLLLLFLLLFYPLFLFCFLPSSFSFFAPFLSPLLCSFPFLRLSLLSPFFLPHSSFPLCVEGHVQPPTSLCVTLWNTSHINNRLWWATLSSQLAQPHSSRLSNILRCALCFTVLSALPRRVEGVDQGPDYKST